MNPRPPSLPPRGAGRSDPPRRTGGDSRSLDGSAGPPASASSGGQGPGRRAQREPREPGGREEEEEPGARPPPGPRGPLPAPPPARAPSRHLLPRPLGRGRRPVSLATRGPAAALASLQPRSPSGPKPVPAGLPEAPTTGEGAPTAPQQDLQAFRSYRCQLSSS